MAPQREKVSPAADRIIETILDAIEPTTWTDVGGTGSITFVPQFEGIVVSQTGACHAQIDDLLARLRKLSLIQQATAEESPVADGGSELSLRAYHVTQHSGAGQPVKDVSSLAQLIQRVVEPQSWQQAERPAFVHVVDDALMIQATNETHDRIVKLLEQLDLAPEPKKPQQGRGGTSGGGGGF